MSAGVRVDDAVLRRIADARPLERDGASYLFVEQVLDKWTLLALYALADGVKRHHELQRALPGLSKRCLVHTLRRLEAWGLVVRTVYAVVPPMVEYALSPLGASLLEPLAGICSWAELHGAELRGVGRDAAE